MHIRWFSGNAWGCNVNEQVIRHTAHSFVSSGLKDKGYSYVVRSMFGLHLSDVSSSQWELYHRIDHRWLLGSFPRSSRNTSTWSKGVPFWDETPGRLRYGDPLHNNSFLPTILSYLTSFVSTVHSLGLKFGISADAGAYNLMFMPIQVWRSCQQQQLFHIHRWKDLLWSPRFSWLREDRCNDVCKLGSGPTQIW